MARELFEIVYTGGVADGALLEAYDGATSFRGLTRTLALLGHYYATGKIISQAPRADVELFFLPPNAGSFRQQIIVGVTSAVIAVPFTLFAQAALQSWFPPNDPQAAAILAATVQQNQLLEAQLSPLETQRLRELQARAASEVADRRTELDVVRSVTSSSFKEIFRPVGRSVTGVAITGGNQRKPIGVVSPQTVGLIDSDYRDGARIGLPGIVNAFSRNSKTGVAFSAMIERGFRFEFMGAERLGKEDIFSWSQFTQREIYFEGEWVYFFDGTIKKLLVYHAEAVDAP